MNIKNELVAMQERMFSDELLNTILAASAEEQEQDGFGNLEQTYLLERGALLPSLNDEQRSMLEKAEVLCRANLHFAMRFAFFQGCYASYQQCFVTDATDTPFQVLVVDELMKIPGMERYGSYYTRREESNAIFESLENTLRGAEREHAISVAGIWDDRLFAVLRYSFYMGYRHSHLTLSSTGHIVEYASITRRTLLTEYELDFIESREDRENLS